MLYVLASDEGGLYYYQPGEDASSYSVSCTNWLFGQNEMSERPAGSSVIVFEKPADGFQFIYHHALPGEGKPSQKFNPRPARESDNLGGTVCLARPNDSPLRFQYTLLPTPCDATSEAEPGAVPDPAT